MRCGMRRFRDEYPTTKEEPDARRGCRWPPLPVVFDEISGRGASIAEQQKLPKRQLKASILFSEVCLRLCVFQASSFCRGDLDDRGFESPILQHRGGKVSNVL